jgi:hypothetical protein
MIKGRRVYGSLEEARTYVLARREDLRKAWELKRGRPLASRLNPAPPSGGGEMITRSR